MSLCSCSLLQWPKGDSLFYNRVQNCCKMFLLCFQPTSYHSVSEGTSPKACRHLRTKKKYYFRHKCQRQHLQQLLLMLLGCMHSKREFSHLNYVVLLTRVCLKVLKCHLQSVTPKNKGLKGRQV